MIDSSNPVKLIESSNELTKLMTEKELKDAALLILANKQVKYLIFQINLLLKQYFILFFKDIQGCATIENITELFALPRLCCGRNWHIQACDAPSGNGLYEGLDWLAGQLVASGVHDLNE